MALLSVLKYPHKVLREISKPVKDFKGVTLEELIRDMFETMYVENGIGLAAPQIGEGIRLVVVDVPKVDPIDPEKLNSDPIALINPEIIIGEGETQYEEGCLSCPELIVSVDRFAKVKIAYQDVGGKKCELKADGLKAICIQHEIDHLNGVLLVDKVSRMERDIYKKKRVREAKEEKDFTNIL